MHVYHSIYTLPFLDPKSAENQGTLKCARFFKTLIHMSKTNKQHSTPAIAKAVTGLVQDIVLKLMQPEEFVEKLQRTLHTQAQPALLPFLRKTILDLRVAVADEEIEIEWMVEEEKKEVDGEELIPRVDGEEYWQCDRSFAGKHLYSLKKGLYADVVFVVGEEEEVRDA